jgi:hypothetical protein
MMDAAEYREKAATARASAVKATDARDRAGFEANAHEWDLLAAKADATDAFEAQIMGRDPTT